MGDEEASQLGKLWSSGTQQRNLFRMERLEATCQGSSESSPRILQIIKRKRRGSSKGGAPEGPPEKGGQKPLVQGAGLSHSRKPRAASSDFFIKENVNRHKSKYGSDVNPGSHHPASIFSSSWPVLLPGGPPPAPLLPLLLGSRSWTAWPSNWSYLGSILKESVFMYL